MRIETHLRASDQWQSVTEIEVHTGLCRRRVVNELNRLLRSGKVERQLTNNGKAYRWLQGERV